MDNLADIEAAARQYIGEKGIGADAVNAYFSISMNLGDAEAMHLMKPARTYADYIRNVKAANNPAVADAIIRLSDSERVAQFDDCVRRMNEVLADEGTAAEKAAKINPILDELEDII